MIKIKDGDLGISYQDSGPWRSYELSECQGETIEDCLKNLTVAEIDQDGDELDCYSYEDASNEIQRAINNLIKEYFSKDLTEKYVNIITNNKG